MKRYILWAGLSLLLIGLVVVGAAAQPPTAGPTVTPILVVVATPQPTPTVVPAGGIGGFVSRYRDDIAKAVIVLIIGTLLGALLKDPLISLRNRLGAWLERQFAASFFFRRRFYRRYCDKLAAELEKMPEFGRAFTLTQVHVYVQVSRDAAGRLDPEKAVAQHECLAVVGDPGVGKSTLLKSLALRYARATRATLFPIFVELKSLPPETTSLKQHLCTVLQGFGFEKAEAFLDRKLEQGQCLVLLDALDEVPSEEELRRAVRLVLDFARKYATPTRTTPANRLVVSCRTSPYKHLGGLTGFQRVEVPEFDEGQMATFIRKWFADNPRRGDRLWVELQNNRRAREMSANPLLLTLIATLYEGHPEQSLPVGRASLYDECVKVRLDRWDTIRKVYRPYKYGDAEKRDFLSQTALDFFEEEGFISEGLLLKRISELLSAAGKEASEDRAQDFLREITAGNALIQEKAPGQYGFSHRTMQEYFAARQLTRQGDEGKLFVTGKVGDRLWEEVVPLYVGLAESDVTDVVQRIYQRADYPARENLLLAARCLVENSRHVGVALRQRIMDDMLDLLRGSVYLVGERPGARPLSEVEGNRLVDWLGAVFAALDFGHWIGRLLSEEDDPCRSNLLLAARLLAWLPRKDEVRGRQREVVLRLLPLLRDPEAATRRAVAAALGWIGHDDEEVAAALSQAREDTDPHVRYSALGSLLALGHGEELGMIRVPAGEFVMGEGDEAHQVYVGEFWIDRYPVANAQYAEFVEAGGYEQPEWWTESGWAWRRREDRTKPEHWDDPRFNPLHHPVVGVTWYEAAAYARWAGKELPTEAQWEKAASWDAKKGEKRVWPWGNEFDPAKCNTAERRAESSGVLGTVWRLLPRLWGREVGRRGTTPVDRFSPAGDSPYGVADMAGNVWEWCSSVYESCPYRADDGRENLEASGVRVLRGGSWDVNRVNARCACRYGGGPGNWLGDVGFRCAKSSP